MNNRSMRQITAHGRPPGAGGPSHLDGKVLQGADEQPGIWTRDGGCPRVITVPEISVETTAGGRAYVKLGDGEVRDSVALGELDEAIQIPSLDSLVLHFDFYGRLTAIEVTGAAESVLPPRLIDE